MADEIEEDVNQVSRRLVPSVCTNQSLYKSSVSLAPQEEYEEGEEGDEEELMDEDEEQGHEGLDDDGEGVDEDDDDGQEVELTEAQAAQMAQIARSLGLPGLTGFGRVPMVVQGECLRLSITRRRQQRVSHLCAPSVLTRTALSTARPPAISEWDGLKSFPAATQASLKQLLGSLRDTVGTELTVLLLGKPGAGKSSTVNSLLGERVIPVAAMQQGGDGGRPLTLGRTAAGFTLTVIDTPGLVDGDTVSTRALNAIAAVLASKTVHAVLYVDRLDSWRVDALDCAVLQAVTDKFGPALWERTVLTLTHGQMTPPDGLVYDAFVQKRSASLRAAVLATLRGKSGDAAVQPSLPLALVENSGRCAVSSAGEKVLPNGDVWLTRLFAAITDVATACDHGGYSYDPEKVPSSDANKAHLWAIAPLLLVQAFVLRPLLVRQMKRDSQAGRPA